MNRFALILFAAVLCVILAGCGSAVTPPAVLSISSTSESFTAEQDGANPAAAAVTVSNTGGGTGIFTQPQSSSFLNLALGAAYTPLSIGPDGRLYTQNNGHLFAVGN
jgi:ABC-type enterochelin transport system substrate-binding protein